MSTSVMSLIRRITGLSPALKVISVALLMVIAAFAYNFVDDWFSKEAETRAELSENQADAAIASGADAVETVGAVNERVTERFYTTERVISEVRNAEDFDTAHAIGVNSLCLNSGVCPQDTLQ